MTKGELLMLIRDMGDDSVIVIGNYPNEVMEYCESNIDHLKIIKACKKFPNGKIIIFNSMHSIPFDYRISVHCGFDSRDPSGLYQTVGVVKHAELKIMELIISND